MKFSVAFSVFVLVTVATAAVPHSRQKRSWLSSLGNAINTANSALNTASNAVSAVSDTANNAVNSGVHTADNVASAVSDTENNAVNTIFEAVNNAVSVVDTANNAVNNAVDTANNVANTFSDDVDIAAAGMEDAANGALQIVRGIDRFARKDLYAEFESAKIDFEKKIHNVNFQRAVKKLAATLDTDTGMVACKDVCLTTGSSILYGTTGSAAIVFDEFVEVGCDSLCKAAIALIKAGKTKKITIENKDTDKTAQC